MGVEKKQTLFKRQDNTSFVLDQDSTTSPYSTPAFFFSVFSSFFGGSGRLGVSRHALVRFTLCTP